MEDKFLTKEEFQILFRPLDLDEAESFDLRLEIVSDALRQEAKNVGKDLDKMLEDKELYISVLKEVCTTILARWYTQPSDMPSMNGTADMYDPSMTFYQSSNMGVSILRKELKRLGLSRQRIGMLGGKRNEYN